MTSREVNGSRIAVRRRVRLDFKLKARVNRSDARTIRQALDQLAAKRSVKRYGDEFPCRSRDGRSQCKGTEPHPPFCIEKGEEERRSEPNGLPASRPSVSSTTSSRRRSRAESPIPQPNGGVVARVRNPIPQRFGCQRGLGRLARFRGDGRVCDHLAAHVWCPRRSAPA